MPIMAADLFAVQDFLPGNAFQADHDCVSFVLLMKRMKNKADLIAKHLRQYQLPSYVDEQLAEATGEQQNSYPEDVLAYFLEVRPVLQPIVRIPFTYLYYARR